MSIQKVNARMIRTLEHFSDQHTFVPCYATRAYIEAYTNNDDTYCESNDSACRWVMNLMQPELVVRVIRGDVERIKALVTRELETYDTELVWE